MAGGQRVLCGTVLLNSDPSATTQRVANELYAKCRSNEVSIPQFPDFNPLLAALRDERSPVKTVVYKVCVEKLGNLCALSSLARKWLENPETKEEAERLISEHNKHFNAGGNYLEDDERTVPIICFKPFLVPVYSNIQEYNFESTGGFMVFDVDPGPRRRRASLQPRRSSWTRPSPAQRLMWQAWRSRAEAVCGSLSFQ